MEQKTGTLRFIFKRKNLNKNNEETMTAVITATKIDNNILIKS